MGEQKKPRARWLLTARGKISLLYGRSTYLEIVICRGMIFAAVLSALLLKAILHKNRTSCSKILGEREEAKPDAAPIEPPIRV